MSGRPAARVGDATEHGTPLGEGPGSDNVIIGGDKAWRGKKKEDEETALDKIQEQMEHVKGVLEVYNSARELFKKQDPLDPNDPDYQQKLEERKEEELKNIEEFGKALYEEIKDLVSMIHPEEADKHACESPSEHGEGEVEDGSDNVFINGLPACRKGDHVTEEAGGEDEIAEGCDSVLIGDENKVLELAEKIGGLADFVKTIKETFTSDDKNKSP